MPDRAFLPIARRWRTGPAGRPGTRRHCRLICFELKTGQRLFADETTALVLYPGRQRTKAGQIWAYTRHDQPWSGAAPPAEALICALDRKAVRPPALADGAMHISKLALELAM